MFSYSSSEFAKKARLCLCPSSSLAMTRASCTRALESREDVALTHGLTSHLQSSQAVFHTAALPLCVHMWVLHLCNNPTSQFGSAVKG